MGIGREQLRVLVRAHLSSFGAAQRHGSLIKLFVRPVPVTPAGSPRSVYLKSDVRCFVFEALSSYGCPLCAASLFMVLVSYF